MSHKYIVWFEEVAKDDVGIVGGKGANLGEMLSAGFPVPYGFIITSSAYFYFMRHNRLEEKIPVLLQNLDFEDSQKLDKVSSQIKQLILAAAIPHDLVTLIVSYYEKLEGRQEKMIKKTRYGHSSTHLVSSLHKAPLVAVRSSATAEDLPNASFAGQQETFLNVCGDNVLLQKIRECFASLFNARAIYYRKTQGFDPSGLGNKKIGLAAVVQCMIESEKSGIAFSIDPVTNDKSKIVIEAIFGLGEYIVQGKVTPDHYEVDKKHLAIIKKDIRVQEEKYIRKGSHNTSVTLGKKEGEKEKLTDDEILSIARLVKDIEAHYYFPQDIEWAIQDGYVYIVQSRPITTLGVKKIVASTSSSFRLILTKGDPASPGIAYGTPVVIISPKEIHKIKKGDVLVAPHTNPDYVPAMKKASAIVTETGGRTSHAAIVSRELGIPAVVGAQNAIKLLRREKIISVNGSTGEIFKGNVLGVTHKIQDHSNTKVSRLHTFTKIYVNLGEPEEAKEVAKLHVDGVGLLRAEFMMAQIGTHPKEIIREKKEKEFITTLAHNLTIFAEAFAPRPVIYRASDFKTNEYRNLKGGKLYEPHEENPMIGFRGASRYISDRQVFDMELDALKKVREKGFRNLHLMIPFLRVPQEFVQIKQIVKEHGLDTSSFKLWIMVEVPSAVILLDQFIAEGVEGVSIGTNDLTMLLLGVDRDSHEVSHLYDERNQAVTWALEKIIKTCKARGVTASICGQAPSDYPELVEKLVKWGITSISVTRDALDRTRQYVYDIEKTLWQK